MTPRSASRRGGQWSMVDGRWSQNLRNVGMKFMRVMTLFLALSQFSQAGTALAKPTKDAEKRCDAASTQIESLGCYLDAAATSRAAVRRAFHRDLQRAITRDRDFGAYAHAHGMLGLSLAQRLRISQVAWLKYSDVQCSLEGQSSLGGSGEDIHQAECHYRLNSGRLAELKATHELLNR